jgi:hypothetical protein
VQELALFGVSLADMVALAGTLSSSFGTGPRLGYELLRVQALPLCKRNSTHVCVCGKPLDQFQAEVAASR